MEVYLLSLKLYTNQNFNSHSVGRKTTHKKKSQFLASKNTINLYTEKYSIWIISSLARVAICLS